MFDLCQSCSYVVWFTISFILLSTQNLYQYFILCTQNPSPPSSNGVAADSSKYAYAEPYAHDNATPPPSGNVSGHYEVDEDYGDPYWHPSSMEDELRMQLLKLKVQEIPRENLQWVP